MIGIVILNYNSSSDCTQCISFIKQQKGIEYEIIIVDNCSKPEDVEQLRHLCAAEKCTLLESEKNWGYSAGNNIGLRYAVQKGCEYALIINPDVELYQTNYLSKLVDVMQQDKAIAMVGSDIINTEGKHQNPMLGDSTNWRSEWGWVKEFTKIAFHCKRNEQYDFVGTYTHSDYCEKLSGCCFLISMNFLREIDFLDENTFLYCEEPILAKQIDNSGNKMYYTAEVQALHKHISSTKGNSIWRQKQFTRSRKYYLRKYSGFTGIGLSLALLSKTLQLFIYTIGCFYQCQRRASTCWRG
jgi:GT2 family glycosyltransferase